MGHRAHSFYLEELIHNLGKVGENTGRIRWLVKEPTYYRITSHNQKPMCDILIGYVDGSARPLELKGSPLKREHAITQLACGVELLNSWGYDSIRDGKIVYYTHGQYTYDLIGNEILNLRLRDIKSRHRRSSANVNGIHQQ